jgi:hypothetical protein
MDLQVQHHLTQGHGQSSITQHGSASTATPEV